MWINFKRLLWHLKNCLLFPLVSVKKFAKKSNQNLKLGYHGNLEHLIYF